MPKNYFVECECGYNALRYRNVKRCPDCGGSVKRSQQRGDELLEKLWDAATEVLYHDVGPDNVEYQFNKRTLIEEWREIIERNNEEMK